ncbi:hypothetical protein M4951_05885 [Blastopirellula sp. J2-11]|uniref:hypothetical protein n=1 Tax=Blastopirellula sp. J2-11 TaxID=2943192 RepID=UPI0021C91E3D|nr:hypothetical protein [Blastopirellula sp. J2-11]UUO07840.1 hypothetical protein M4951_05885 [Blastopirellula sp. J2-11]
MMKTGTSVAIAAALATLLLGCSSSRDDLQLMPVTGVVTYQGEPIRDGVIRLIPAEGTEAPVRVRKIKEGAYQFTGRSAVAAGIYRVEISAYRPVDDAAPSEEGLGVDLPRVQYLPKQFNTDSQIELLEVSNTDSEVAKDFVL